MQKHIEDWFKKDFEQTALDEGVMPYMIDHDRIKELAIDKADSLIAYIDRKENINEKKI